MKKKPNIKEGAITTWVVTATITAVGNEREYTSRIIVQCDEQKHPDFLHSNPPIHEGCKWLGDYFKHDKDDKVSLFVEKIPASIAKALEGTSLQAVTPDDVTAGYHLVIQKTVTPDDVTAGYHLVIQYADHLLKWEWLNEDKDIDDATIIGKPGESQKSIAQNIWELSAKEGGGEHYSVANHITDLKSWDMWEAGTYLELLEAAEQGSQLLQKHAEDKSEVGGDGGGYLYETYQENPQLLRWFLCHLLRTSTKAHNRALKKLAMCASYNDRDYEVLIWAAQFSAYPPVAPFDGAELLYNNTTVVENKIIIID